MTPRHKTFLVVTITLISLIALLYLITSTILLDGFAQVEAQDTQRNVDRARDALTVSLSSLDKKAWDWANWDDTYRFVEDANSEFIQTNPTDSTFSQLDLNLMVFVNTSGQIVYAKAFDLDAQHDQPVPQSLTAYLSPGSLLLQYPDLQAGLKGILLLSEGPLLLAARPILTSEEKGPSHGTLIFGRFLDADEIKALAGTTHLTLTVERLGDSQLSSDFKIARSALSETNSIFVHPLSSTVIGGYTLLHDINGSPALLLRVEVPRSIYGQAEVSTHYLLASLFVVGLALFLVTQKRIENLVLAAVARQETEKRYDAVVEQTAEGIFLFDLQTRRVLEANTAFQNLLGYTAAEIIGLHIDDFVINLRQGDQGCGLSLLAGKFPLQGECPYRRKDGSWVEVEVSANLIRYGGRQVTSVVVRDITERKQREQALVEERNLMRTLIDNMPDYIFVKDAESRFMLDNLAHLHLLKATTQDELVGKTDFDIFPHALAAQYYADEQQVMRSGQPLLNREELTIDPQGRQQWLLTTKVPLRDSHGNVLELVGISRDITDRKQMEEALRASEKKYRQLIETLQEGVWVIDQQAYTTFVNPRMAEMLGYTVGEMQGKHLFAFMDERGVEIAKRNLERRQQGIHEQHDFEFLRKDGSRIFTTLEAAPITDDDGKYAGAIAAVVDITARQQAAEALKASEQYAKSIIDSSLDMIISVDRERRIVEFNRAAQATFGYRKDEVLGQYISLLYADAAEGQVVHQTTFKEGKVVREIFNKRKNGEVFPSFLSASIMKDENGELMGVVGVSRDITERKRAEAELKESERRYRELFSAAQRQTQELSLLDRVRSTLARELELPIILRTVVEAIAQTFGYTQVSLYLVQSDTLILQHQVGYDHIIERIPLTQGISGRVVRSGQPALLEDAGTDPAFLGAIGGITSKVCVPLFDQGRVVGVLNVESTQGVRLGEADLRLMQMLSEDISIALGQARLYAEVQRLAITDDLTGTPNRRHFFKLGEKEFSRTRRLGHPLCAIMLDLDDFKKVNDKYGHAIGDDVLRAVAERLRNSIRESDILGRYGGEEFCMLLPQTDLGSATQLAERLRHSVVEAPITTNRDSIATTLSVGVAIATADTPDLAALLDRADAAMYAAKQAGGNRLVVTAFETSSYSYAAVSTTA